MNRRGMLIFIALNVIISVGVASLAIVLWQNSQPEAQIQTAALPTASQATNAQAGSFPVIVTTTPGPTQTPWIVTATSNVGQVVATQPSSTPDAGGDAGTVAPTLDSTTVLLTLSAEGGLDTGDGAEVDAGAGTGVDAGVASGPAEGTYVVQEGDNPSIIAETLGVSLADLLCANGLGTIDEPEFIFAGDELIVPGPDFVCEEVAVSDDVTPLAPGGDGASPLATVPGSLFVDETPLAQVTLASTATDSQVAIVRVLEPGELTSEGVELRNLGGLIDLEGWSLYDTQGNTYIFPDYRLFPNAGVTVFSRAGVDTPAVLFWGQPQAVWQSGDAVTLVNVDGEAQATFVVGVDGLPGIPPATQAP